MNITGNARGKTTIEKIEKAVFDLLRKRRYDDFTIKDICAEAGINRSSFYAHYDDINDLMIKIETNLAKQLQTIWKPTTEYKEMFVNFFNFIKEHKEFYKSFLKSGNPSFTANDMLKQNKEWLKHLSASKGMNYSEIEIEYHLNFFGGGLKAICGFWIKNDCKETPEQMAQFIENEYKNNAKFT